MPARLPLLWTDVPLHRDALDALRDGVALAGPNLPAEVVASSSFGFADADAAIVGPRFRGDAAAIASALRLRVIARTGIGYDNVDVPAASAAGVCALNTPDAPTESTAEFALGLMFAVARRIAMADRNSKAGVWKQDGPIIGFDLAEKTLGLVGFGRIARRVTEVARALRMRVCAFDPFVPAETMATAGVARCADLPELLRQSQVVSLHAPLGPDTRRLIGAAQIALLPRGAILINTARGPLLDETALLDALDRGHLSGAGIDVYETEPAPAGHPVLQHPLIVATSHIASYTDEGRRRSHVRAALDVLAVLRGEPPPTLIDQTMWSRRRT